MNEPIGIGLNNAGKDFINNCCIYIYNNRNNICCFAIEFFKRLKKEKYNGKLRLNGRRQTRAFCYTFRSQRLNEYLVLRLTCDRPFSRIKKVRTAVSVMKCCFHIDFGSKQSRLFTLLWLKYSVKNRGVCNVSVSHIRYAYQIAQDTQIHQCTIEGQPSKIT